MRQVLLNADSSKGLESGAEGHLLLLVLIVSCPEAETGTFLSEALLL